MKLNEVRKMKLTRKHFVLVAEVVGHINDQQNREEQADQWGYLFETTHPVFDRERFNAHIEEVHASCWEDDGPIFERGV
jgi:hypothetical protein